jgi:hypothetical protein
MKEISLHIMDISENGIGAGADTIRIILDENRLDNRLILTIADNGRGIPPEILKKVTDPFYTSRTTRRVGLGLSLLKAAAERCNGTFKVASTLGEGSEVSASFEYGHIDRAPIGDIANTLGILIMGNPDIDFIYKHVINGKEFEVDTREIKTELEGMNIADPHIIQHLMKIIREGISQLDIGTENIQQ